MNIVKQDLLCKTQFLKLIFKWYLKGGISIYTDSGLLGYVLWCCGSRTCLKLDFLTQWKLVFEPQGLLSKMCQIVWQKWGHTRSTTFVRWLLEWWFNELSRPRPRTEVTTSSFSCLFPVATRRATPVYTQHSGLSAGKATEAAAQLDSIA